MKPVSLFQKVPERREGEALLEAGVEELPGQGYGTELGGDACAQGQDAMMRTGLGLWGKRRDRQGSQAPHPFLGLLKHGEKSKNPEEVGG